MSNSLQPHGLQHAAFLFFTMSWSLLKLVSIESVMPSNHLILWRPLLFLLSVFPSIRVFSNELAFCNRWSKYWGFSFSISSSNVCVYIYLLLLLLLSHPIMSTSLWTHGLQPIRPPCPSSSPGVCPNSCSLHRWCCAAISSSDALFSFYPQYIYVSDQNGMIQKP